MIIEEKLWIVLHKNICYGYSLALKVRDLSRVRQYPLWLLLSIPWGTEGTTHRRHANNYAHEIDDFIGCEGDFSI